MDPQNLNAAELRKLIPSGSQWRSGVVLVVALFLAVILWNLWFTVEPEEVGVVFRFGRYVREAPPGLNFKLPDPVESVIKVPVQRQLKEEFGYRTQLAGVQTRYTSDNFQGESLMLTGDLNVAVVEWSSQYRINDPYRYLVKVRDVRTTFREMNEAVMREVVGDRTVNDLLTIGRQQVADEVKTRLQALCEQYDTGITVDQVVLQDVNPPDPVKPSFNEVNQAQQEREKMINQAKAEYNRIIPKARGQALQAIQQAEGYAKDRINRAKGDARFFELILGAYKRAPKVTKRRIYLETIDTIYPEIKHKVIVDDKVKGILPLLSLGSEVKP
ncbi:MAG: FtsH protease activity modulator HflK [Thermodesulfobacteriota bacterium]|nr:FtsH protease activity modulator HflK [Thermodesulfobacteriota bacterium]